MGGGGVICIMSYHIAYYHLYLWYLAHIFCYMYLNPTAGKRHYHVDSKVTMTYQKFSIVWLPRLKCLLLLWKMKTTWIKRSNHYVTLQCYNPGELLKEIPPNLNRDFWHCLRKRALKSKHLHQNYWSWCHFAGKRIFYSLMHSLIWSSPWFLWN